MRRVVAFAFAMTCAHVASAQQQPSETDVALAQSLFEEGTSLMRQGNFEEACPKLKESQRLDPGGGTLLNLALCYEKVKRYASAYLAYNEALALAERDKNTSREQSARERLAAIKTLVPRVVIRIAKETAALEGLEVHFDTANVQKPAWGVEAPVDAGEHTISVTAPGKKEWRKPIEIEGAASVTEVIVPKLDDLAPVSQPPPPLVTLPISREERPTTQRDAGWVLVGVGGLSAIVGIFTASAAVVRHEDSKRGCMNKVCTPEGFGAEQDANAFAWAANISFGAALLSAGVGAVLVLTAPKSRSTTVAVGPSWIGLEGSF